MNKAVGPESDETKAELRAANPPDTSVPSREIDTAGEGETMARPPRIRAAELPIVPDAHYDRENEIARGGMGRIVAAWDRRMGRPVAIKELLRGTDDLRRRFEREAVMTGRLQHPAIINVYEAGRWPTGEPFYAMKRVDGVSLADAIQRTKSLHERLALLPNLISIADAMAYAHGQSVIHRDLKPANVLLGSFGETVVIDWGLAKDLTAGPEVSEDLQGDAGGEDGLTVVGTVLGTPGYMPPEQASGRAVDQRADVYALGAILYHLLDGRPPYTGPTSADVLKQVLGGPPTSLDDQVGISPDLLAIVRKAMAREPDRRYPTAKELAEDLRRFQTGQLVGAHAYTTKELLSRWVARHRAPASIAAVAALLLITTGILAVQRIARERNEAQSARRDADARNDELVLNQARNSLKEDPTAAIAWLKNYSLDAPSWSAARMIAADARSQGVATKVLVGHEHKVHRVAFSPDGRLLASAGADRIVRLWDLASGTSRVLKGHDWFVYSLEFSPDGKWLASAGLNMLWLWNVATGEGRSVRGPFIDGDIAFSPDSRSLVALGYDAEGLYVHLWDPQTGFARILRDPADKETDVWKRLQRPFHLAMSPDGGTLFGKTDGETLRRWDMKTGRMRKLPGGSAFALSDDGQLLATAGKANGVGIHDLATGNDRILAGLSGPVSALAFSPDRQWIASGSEDSLVRLWDLTTGKLRILRGHSGEVRGVVFSPDSRTLGSFTDDRTVRLWEVASGDGRTLRGHLEEVDGIAFSPDGRSIASASDDRTIRLWPVGAGDHRILFRPDSMVEGPTRRIAFGPHGRVLAATRGAALIDVWDLDAGVQRVLTGHDDTKKRDWLWGIRTLVFSPDGKALASAGSDATIRLWDLANGESRKFSGHEDSVEGVAFSPDGTRLASVGLDKMVRLWDVAKGIGRVLPGHLFSLRHVAFSPDGRWFASAARGDKSTEGQQDLTVRLWDASSGKPHELAGHEDTVTDVQFSADGRTIASGSMDTTVRLWDAATGRSQRVLRGDGSMVNEVALSRDGRWLASGTGGGVRLWNLATGQSLLLKGWEPTFFEDGATLAASGSGVAWLWDTATGEGRVLPGADSNVAISPDGKLVAAIGKDGAIHLWDDDLPRDPTALKAWLEKATEYKVSAGLPVMRPEPDMP